MNHEEVIARFKEVNVTDLFFTKKEVKELPNILRDEEIIMYATSGFMDGNTWLITLTNRRILFLDRGMIYGLKQVDMPIEKINSISYKKGLVFGSITIYHGSGNMEVKQISKTTIAPLTEAINKEIEEHNNKSSLVKPPNETSDFSLADELFKFKQLLDDGAITQEEYDDMKKNLLNNRFKS